MSSNLLNTRFFFLMTIVSLCIIAFFSDLSTANKWNRGIELKPRNDSTLVKRDTGDITFYDVGLGACGKTNSNSDLICALSRADFGSSPGGNSNKNPSCGKTITITCPGSKSVTVKVVDLCEGCKSGDLDLSPTAFNHLAKASVGRLQCDWEFS
ncbi:expansin module family protein [Gigaspora rosea]|uniref:Expansin module family protein n=1 Tax=Gigaspora rosea TaxID=44941 RepID=A0A397W442_9GLOM|nr:expansin module family protein [Gigaspora rosea]